MAKKKTAETTEETVKTEVKVEAPNNTYSPFSSLTDSDIFSLYQCNNILIHKYDNEAQANSVDYPTEYGTARERLNKYIAFKDKLIEEIERRVNILI
jgi:hypothetical protein